MIRVRRVRTPIPLVRLYELEFARGAESTSAERTRLRRGAAVRRLERSVGVGDAWSFVDAADRAWTTGSPEWAVEFDEGGP